MRVLMIIPAYNEEKNIENTVKSILKFKETNLDFELDYIVINDGSTDATKDICKQKKIECINLIQNLGIGGAVQTGYIYASMKGYDVAVQFDGDGQHDISSLPHLLEPLLKKEANFVIGSRFIDKSSEFQSTALRRFGIKWLSKLIKLLYHSNVTDPTSGFRAADRKIINMFATQYPSDYPEPESIAHLLKNNVKIQEIQVNMFERVEGNSSINMWKSVYYMLKVSLAIICTKFQI